MISTNRIDIISAMGNERNRVSEAIGHLSHTEFYALLLLSKGERHGYQIMTDTRELFGVEIPVPTLYWTVDKLEKDKLIKRQNTLYSSRKVLSITTQGRATLAEEVKIITDALDYYISSSEPKKF